MLCFHTVRTIKCLHIFASRVCQVCSLCFPVQRHFDYSDIPHQMMQVHFIAEIMLNPSEQETLTALLKYMSDRRSEIIPRKRQQFDTLIKLPRLQWFVVCCNIISNVKDNWCILHCPPRKRGHFWISMAIYTIFLKITAQQTSTCRLRLQSKTYCKKMVNTAVKDGSRIMTSIESILAIGPGILPLCYAIKTIKFCGTTTFV